MLMDVFMLNKCLYGQDYVEFACWCCVKSTSGDVTIMGSSFQRLGRQARLVYHASYNLFSDNNSV
jgi:hypothetical protein